MERKRKNVWREPNADESPIPLIESKGFIFVMQRFPRYRDREEEGALLRETVTNPLYVSRLEEKNGDGSTPVSTAFRMILFVPMNKVESTNLSLKKVSDISKKIWYYTCQRFVNFTTHLGTESQIKEPMTLQNVFVRRSRSV